MKSFNYETKENILASAKVIASIQGIHKINIRSVAQKSGVSIGTVYNYYATKADLLVAVIEDFWAEASKEIDLKSLEKKNFFDKLQDIYNSFYQYFYHFRTNWLQQMSLLSVEEKKLGRTKEQEYMSAICSLIVSLMDSDKNVSKKLLENRISKERMAEFIFDNMLLMLKKNEKDSEFFIKVLMKIMS